MSELTSIFTRVTFRNSSRVFKIPVALEINPENLLDEKNNVYRVSIGKLDLTPEEKKQYTALYRMLDHKMPFVDGITFEYSGARLLFDLAYIMRTKHDTGIFYDIEAKKEDVIFSEKDIECNSYK